MTFVSAAPSRARFRLGEALEATFEAVFAHFGLFFLLALTISALPHLVLALAVGPAAVSRGTPAGAFLGLFRGVLNLVLGAVLQGALVRGVITHLNGQRPTFALCLRSGLATILSLTAIGLLAGIGIVVGFLCLVVPGLFLLAVSAVVGPAQVIERPGVFGAFSRSAELTRGHRWAVLGAILVIAVVFLVVVALGSAVVGLIGGVGALAARVTRSGWPVFAVSTLINLLATAIGSIFASAAPAAIYHQLRRSKEGAGPAQLAEVFD